MNRYTSKARSGAAANNDIRPPKRRKLDEIDDSDDDFPDADLTVEEFDLCLTQATGATSKPTGSTTDTGNVSNGLPCAAIKDLSYSLDGQIQLLQRKVASLSKELHDTRLGKQDELKAQADAFAKERHDLKAQIEFKDGELRSCAIRQATLEEKLRGKGIETRLKQMVEQATSTSDAPGCSTSNGNVTTTAPKRIVTLSRGSNKAAWLSSQYGMHALRSVKSDHIGLAHLDVLRDYASKRKTCDVAQVVPNAVILSLRGLGECINETLTCTSTTDSSAAERVGLSAEKYNEGFVFDVLADLSMVEDPTLLAAVVSLLNAFALSSEQACSAILKQQSMLSHLLQQVGVEPVTIPIFRLLGSLANIDNSLAPFCCSSVTAPCCMWKCLCKPFERHVTVPLLHEGLHLAQQASCMAQSLCPCFAWFVTKLSQKVRALQLSSAGLQNSNALLSRICAIAQTQPQHRQQACRLLTPTKYHSRLVHAWPFVDDDTANQSPTSDQD